MSIQQDERGYAQFLTDTTYGWCWYCGRGLDHKPQSWFGPWLIERAHIANNPRMKDRRVVILLCSWCHRVQHGEQLVLLGMVGQAIAPTVPKMLALKKVFDPDYYDRDYIAKCCIGKLPVARLSQQAKQIYLGRRGVWPKLMRSS